MELKLREIRHRLDFSQTFNRTIFGIETVVPLWNSGFEVVLLVEPFLELKPDDGVIFQMAQKAFNRTIFGIETRVG